MLYSCSSFVVPLYEPWLRSNMPTSKGGGVVVGIGCLLLLVRWELSTLQNFLLLRVVSTTYSLIFLFKVVFLLYQCMGVIGSALVSIISNWFSNRSTKVFFQIPLKSLSNYTPTTHTTAGRQALGIAHSSRSGTAKLPPQDGPRG